jgi:putative proteasome-type protease
MTYCVGIRLNAGLVFLSDSRTNAGLDAISTFRKMIVYEKPGDRFMVLLSAGNLSISQSVREILQVEQIRQGDGEPLTIWNATEHVRRRARARQRGAPRLRPGRPVAEARRRRLQRHMIFGGQIRGEAMRLFLVYSAGNFIEATRETCFFQIGESKYGKPILDRVLTPVTPLDEAAKCALVSMDSTLKSNLSVGLPLDLLVYDEGRCRAATSRASTTQPVLPHDPQHLGPAPARGLRGIDDPHWSGQGQPHHPLLWPSERFEPMRKIRHHREKIV